MALTLPNRYPGRFNPPSTEYPQGSFKNRTAPGALDGSYLEQDWANDKEGFFQSLIDAAGLTPNDVPDEVGASQYFDALQSVIDGAGLIEPDGWKQLGSGLILQWGSEETPVGTTTSESVVFPTTFPTACYSVSAVLENNTVNAAPYSIGIQKDAGGFTAYLRSTGAAVFFNGSPILWMAIGE